MSKPAEKNIDTYMDDLRYYSLDFGPLLTTKDMTIEERSDFFETYTQPILPEIYKELEIQPEDTEFQLNLIQPKNIFEFEEFLNEKIEKDCLSTK